MDVTFQNLDSSEISLTDVSHYFDNDPTKVVGNLRKDGVNEVTPVVIAWVWLKSMNPPLNCT